MTQASVEEIFAAAQKLPSKERRRLSELLQREAALESKVGLTPSDKAIEESANGKNSESCQAEMQWLLDHPDFWEQHRGEHVALWGYKMITVGKTRKEVVAEARRKGIQFPFVQYLPKREAEWLLGFSNQPVAAF